MRNGVIIRDNYVETMENFFKVQSWIKNKFQTVNISYNLVNFFQLVNFLIIF